MAHTVQFSVVRNDGVRFIYNRVSPNGTEINFLTAHNTVWASVPVGRFATASEALQAIDGFVMPTGKKG